jgi:hypothetical protein
MKNKPRQIEMDRAFSFKHSERFAEKIHKITIM